MPLYVMLVNWTDQGARNVRSTVKRADAVVAAARKQRCEVLQLLWTMGAYDALAIFDAPNDQAMSTLALSIASQGNVRTLTMRAYEKAEMNKIIAGVR
ncbi:MAG TPA: GYD domain-containing protein [bacterium]|nr:GYD domain-containing protein [bacterium]